jgi:hypothetical protein
MPQAWVDLLAAIESEPDQPIASAAAVVWRDANDAIQSQPYTGTADP